MSKEQAWDRLVHLIRQEASVEAISEARRGYDGWIEEETIEYVTRPEVWDDIVNEVAISVTASDLGRRGGLVGGPARASALSPERRSEIARRAARARWDRT